LSKPSRTPQQSAEAIMWSSHLLRFKSTWKNLISKNSVIQSQSAAAQRVRYLVNLAENETITTLTPETQKTILERCVELHGSIQPLNDSVKGPLGKSGDRTTKLPFVFLLGNHSSGKSSFINYVLKKQVQTAGVAPTDDSFTIISPGPKDMDQDGPALVGDPDMGFAGLRHFGPALIHHTCLKVRTGIATQSFMMVDSPGMIDSPAFKASAFEDNMETKDARGYDFQGVVRWFAERADVILLFFDPDKPGTTGETLSVLTNSLVGLDHKLYIILNKADQFKKIHDFARAYGSLCWNLSKVIQRKDLPRIFTMCLPIEERLGLSYRPTPLPSNQNITLQEQSGLKDLEQTREDVVGEVFKAPKRRIDNVITRLTDSVHLLEVHCTILSAVQKSYRRHLWQARLATGGTLTCGVGLTASAVLLEAPVNLTGIVGVTAVLLTAGMQFYNSKVLKEEAEYLLSADGLNHVFETCYASELAEGDEFVAAVWKRIRDGLKINITANGLSSFPTVTNSQLQNLQQILDEDVPSLRRLAAPTHFTLENQLENMKKYS